MNPSAVPAHDTIVPHVRTADELAGVLEGLGYLPGPPVHITAATVAIDAQVARALRCQGCRRRGLTYRAFHRGVSYRALAVCQHCGAAEDL